MRHVDWVQGPGNPLKLSGKGGVSEISSDSPECSKLPQPTLSQEQQTAFPFCRQCPAHILPGHYFSLLEGSSRQLCSSSHSNFTHRAPDSLSFFPSPRMRGKLTMYPGLSSVTSGQPAGGARRLTQRGFVSWVGVSQAGRAHSGAVHYPWHLSQQSLNQAIAHSSPSKTLRPWEWEKEQREMS